MTDTTPHITRLLKDWHAGDDAALDNLLPTVIEELRRIARRHLAREAPGHTLQPTALVNEVYLRLAGRRADLESRIHFFAFAARLMREILVDHARARRTRKRGGDAQRVDFEAALGVAVNVAVDLDTVLAVDDALRRLEALDAEQSRIVEMRYFSGLTLPEIAEVMEISLATVERRWSVARRWLAREISTAPPTVPK